MVSQTENASVSKINKEIAHSQKDIWTRLFVAVYL